MFRHFSYFRANVSKFYFYFCFVSSFLFLLLRLNLTTSLYRPLIHPTFEYPHSALCLASPRDTAPEKVLVPAHRAAARAVFPSVTKSSFQMANWRFCAMWAPLNPRTVSTLGSSHVTSGRASASIVASIAAFSISETSQPGSGLFIHSPQLLNAQQQNPMQQQLASPHKIISTKRNAVSQAKSLFVQLPQNA